MHPIHDFPRQPLDCHGRLLSVGDQVEGFFEQLFTVEALIGDTVIYTRDGVQLWSFACIFKKVCPPPEPLGIAATVAAAVAPEPEEGTPFSTSPDSDDCPYCGLPLAYPCDHLPDRCSTDRCIDSSLHGWLYHA